MVKARLDVGMALITAMSRESAASVRFEPYESLSARGGWQRELPNEEDALCVAAGSSFAAVATDAHSLHILSLSGVHTVTLTLAGPPLALAGLGSTLVATWHRGSPTVDGHQCIDYMVRCQDTDAAERSRVLDQPAVSQEMHCLLIHQAYCKAHWP